VGRLTANLPALPHTILNSSLLSPVTDFAIAGLMLWKLGLGDGQSYSPNTDDVLQRLRNLTVEAAVPPAICATLTMSIYLSTVRYFCWTGSLPSSHPELLLNWKAIVVNGWALVEQAKSRFRNVWDNHT
ncbi:hypothetical protein FRC01_005001, partial [Tulasnella sp. 417]